MGPNQIRSSRLNYLLKKFLHNPNITVYESALAIINDLSYLEPDNEIYRTLRSQVLLSQERVMEALLEAAKAIDVDKYNSEAWLVYAECQLLQGRWQEAFHSINETLKLVQENADAWFLKARILAVNRKDEEAIDALTVAISIDNDYKKEAKEDSQEDFRIIKNDPRFQRIIK